MTNHRKTVSDGAIPKPQGLTQKRADMIAVAGMFSKMHRKPSRKLRPQGWLAQAVADSGVEIRYRTTQERRRLR